MHKTCCIFNYLLSHSLINLGTFWCYPITCCENKKTDSFLIMSMTHLGYCCDRKAQAENSPSFTMWQQATIEIMHRNQSTIACACHLCMGAVLRTHPAHGESHIQRNDNQEVATVSIFIFHPSCLLLDLWKIHVGVGCVILQYIKAGGELLRAKLGLAK